MDIIAVRNTGPYVENVDIRAFHHQFVVPREWFFPVHMRPLGGLWVPVPRDPWLILSMTYHDTTRITCRSSDWNHLEEHPREVMFETQCRNIKHLYPLAWRKPYGGKLLEVLKLGNQRYYSVLLDEPYYKMTNPFTWTFTKYVFD